MVKIPQKNEGRADLLKKSWTTLLSRLARKVVTYVVMLPYEFDRLLNKLCCDDALLGDALCEKTDCSTQGKK